MAQSWIHPELAYISAKAESTYGTDAAGTPATDGVMLRKLDMKKSIQQVDLDRRRESFASPGKRIGQVWYEIEAEVPAGGPDVAAGDLATPEVLPFLLASGFSHTAQDIGTTGNTNRHLFESNSRGAQASLTLDQYLVRDGEGVGGVQLRRALGCVFVPKLTIPNDGEAFWTFTGKGLYTPDTNPAVPSASVFDHEDDGIVGKGATLSLYGRTEPVANITVEWEHEIVMRPSLDETYGVAGFRLVLGPPKITIDPEFVLLSSFDRDAAVLAETLAATSLSFPTLKLAKWVFSAAESQIGAYTLDTGGPTVSVATEIYPRDTLAGVGDDALSFYCQRVSGP